MILKKKLSSLLLIGCRYTGVDAAAKYIESAKEIFQDDAFVQFTVQDSHKLNKTADIVFYCNILLHLPSIKVPLTNLSNGFNHHLIIRTLISEKIHLSQFLYSDTFDKNGNPTDFAFQNTHSFDYMKALVNQVDPSLKIDFIKELYDAAALQNEGNDWKNKQGFAMT